MNMSSGDVVELFSLLGSSNKMSVDDYLSGGSCIRMPWKLPEVPSYEPFAMEDWELKEGYTPFIIRGYFYGLQKPQSQNWVLTKDDTIWMSTTPMELESHAMHVDFAHGHTVIVGAGMGVILYNVLKNPNVEMVTLIEKDVSVLELLDHLGLENWEGYEKLVILHRDALTDNYTVFPADFLYVDIWERMGMDQASKDVCTIQKKVNANHVGFWCQELEFLHWAAEENRPTPLSLADYQDFKWSIGIPNLIGDTYDRYVELCWQAASNVANY